MDEKSGDESPSLGLKGIESRVGFMKGKLDLWSEPGQGIRYIIEIPV